jgi:hypothetical protein
MKTFLILKVGAELHKRFLQKTMCKDRWTSSSFAHSFLSLEEAETEAKQHENVRIIWSDGQAWGDVT